MPRALLLTDIQKGQIQALSEEGYSKREIGRRLEISEKAVRYNLAKLENTGSMENLVRSGRPRVTTVREDRTIVRYSLQDR